jgi:hypothetical protein
VPALRDVINRFRVVGPPGPAAPAAVPADRRTELAEELAPVFAALTDTRARARDIVRAAELEAARIRTEGDRRAEELLSTAAADRDAVRAAAFAAAQQMTTRQAARLGEDGRLEAEIVERRAAEHRPDLVARAMRKAHFLLAPHDSAAEPR